nr:Chain B, Distinctin chain B [synthetic construct]1XKM_D Chain D, Distinctin chain B [synthetic construct]
NLVSGLIEARKYLEQLHRKLKNCKV